MFQSHSMVKDFHTELQKIETAIAAQEALLGQGILPDEQIESTLASLRTQRDTYLVRGEQGDENQSVEQDGVLVEGSVDGDIITGTKINQKAGDNALQIGQARDINIEDQQYVAEKVYVIQGDMVVGEQPVEISAEKRGTVLGRYLEHVIAHNRYLQHQGIRSGGRLVNIELDQIYITLRATKQLPVTDDDFRQYEENWLAEEAALAPGERVKSGMERTVSETVNVRVEQALNDHRHLVVLGDPGSGKTTLLRYLALLYARDLAQAGMLVAELLQLPESGYLPILLPLRKIGAFLRVHHPNHDGTDGLGLLIEFLNEYLENERVPLPADFFDSYLNEGRAVVLLDGLDEVADPELRGRVARLVESFSLKYAKCRFVVTSRIVGYTGSARLTGDYTAATVRNFTLADVRQFLTHWHRLIAVGQMGLGESATNEAARQTDQLMQAIEKIEQIRELAINPLMLTVIALVHRDRVKLPDRRAELYAEAVDVLLGKWDEARGVKKIPILEDRAFDTGDRRLLLQSIALHMHEEQQKEIDAEKLRHLLSDHFSEILEGGKGVRQAVERFQLVIQERTGLLAARGEGIYAFSHLTFQEYLAALAVAGRDDYVTYSLERCSEAWWKEVILLEAGYLSTQGKERTTRLITEIANSPKQSEPFHNQVLAAECIQDVGSSRIEGDLLTTIQNELRTQLETPTPTGWFQSTKARIFTRMSPEEVTRQRIAAAGALAKIGGGQYWSRPYGEPDWVAITAGEFWMGSNSMGSECPEERIYLPEFQIAKVPITNTQYDIFVKETKHVTPRHWEDGRIPKGKESHPVIVEWNDAIAYCQWLSRVTGKTITLPSEAEWEKAARGSKDKRIYPWGDKFEVTHCNTNELELGDTTPVGIFMTGASPYGVLDLSGNVWEWTRSKSASYPYNASDGRESLDGSDHTPRILRGGCFLHHKDMARCFVRTWSYPLDWPWSLGFRVVAVPLAL